MTKKDVLVICAHSDDQILGPGATLAKYASEGVKVHTIISSYGEMSHPHLREGVIQKQRVNEAKEADKVIGGTGVTFLGLRDGKQSEDYSTSKYKKDLMSIIKKYNPERIFTHSDQDPMPDHRAVHNAVIEALDRLKLKTPVFTFEVWTFFRIRSRDHPKLVVDVSDSFSKKIDALECFKSQWHAILLLKWSVYVKAILNGLRRNVKFAEVFDRIR
ncbi:PIG-L deacetylase family protein [Nanoarchaeota archaeon]